MASGAAPAAPAASTTPAPATPAAPATPTPAPAAPAAPATPAAPAAPASGEKPPWFAERYPAEQHDFIKNKGWDGDPAILESYINLEKIMGADKANRTLLLPKEDATPEEREDFYRKAGITAPEKKEAYYEGLEIPEQMLSTPLVQGAPDFFQKAGVPKEMAQKVMKEVIAAETQMEQQFQTESKNQLQEIALKYGTKFADKAELGKRAATASGIDEATMDKIERSIGTAKMMEMFFHFGENMVEGTPPGPGEGGGNQFRLSTADAQTKVNNLFGDAAFMARYTSPNEAIRKPAIEEMERYQKIIAEGSVKK